MTCLIIYLAIGVVLGIRAAFRLEDDWMVRFVIATGVVVWWPFVTVVDLWRLGAYWLDERRVRREWEALHREEGGDQ